MENLHCMQRREYTHSLFHVLKMSSFTPLPFCYYRCMWNVDIPIFNHVLQFLDASVDPLKCNSFEIKMEVYLLAYPLLLLLRNGQLNLSIFGFLPKLLEILLDFFSLFAWISFPFGECWKGHVTFEAKILILFLL